VNSYRQIPVSLILVDTGPLITLAACNRLELLGAFARPIRIVDVVRAECLRHADRIGTKELAYWFQQIDGKTVDVIATPFMEP
jgi:hypothetical protein